MIASRRSFLRTVSAGAGAATVAPAVSPLFAEAGNASDRAPSLIRLNSNENAYGTSADALVAMREALLTANRYPLADCAELRDEIARLHAVKSEQIILGCGSTEILRMAACAFLDGGGELIQASPTYETMEAYARAVGARVTSIPLTKDFAHDVSVMLASVRIDRSLVYVCNPNNPTGSLTPLKDLDRLLNDIRPSAHVVVDEAYHHYAAAAQSYRSLLDRPVINPRLIVVRTFSTVYGLAGMRVGYAVAAEDVARRLRGYSTDKNVNIVAARAALAALRDTAFLERAVRKNADDRQEYFNQAMARMLKPIDSHANFVMMDTHRPAAEVVEHFRRREVQIAGPYPRMITCIRTSLGTVSEMARFWQVWDQMPITHMKM